jgi:hypothetical protein
MSELLVKSIIVLGLIFIVFFIVLTMITARVRLNLDFLNPYSAGRVCRKVGHTKIEKKDIAGWIALRCSDCGSEEALPLSTWSYGLDRSTYPLWVKGMEAMARAQEVAAKQRLLKQAFHTDKTEAELEEWRKTHA